MFLTESRYVVCKQDCVTKTTSICSEDGVREARSIGQVLDTASLVSCNSISLKCLGLRESPQVLLLLMKEQPAS